MNCLTPSGLDVDTKLGVSPIEDIIEEARRGRMFILVDDEDRENEGDLVIPAETATPEAINFMATHGRGLVCLSLTQDRVDQLGLPMMAQTNAHDRETAFTVSIDARAGITTGISAHDRARTVAVAIDDRAGPSDLASPGHLFPLRARDGGVLTRPGHTEASVDIARLAGRVPAGVICEILNPDGTMARLPDLLPFAHMHQLKIGTINDLVAYRRRHNRTLRLRGRRDLAGQTGGSWTMFQFAEAATGAQHAALVMGDITDGTPVRVDVQTSDPARSRLTINAKTGLDDINASMVAVAQEGRGVILLLDTAATTEPGTPRTMESVFGNDGLAAQMLALLGVSGGQVRPVPWPTGTHGSGEIDLNIGSTQPSKSSRNRAMHI